MTFFPTHWRMFAIAWLIHAVRYAVANGAALPQTPNGTFVDRLSSKRRLPAWPPIFGSLHIGFRFPSNRESVSVRVLDRSLVAPAQHSLPNLSRSIGTSNPCAPFPRSKTRQDSTSPRKCPARGRVPLLSRCSLRVSGTLWDPIRSSVSRSSQSLQSFALTPKTSYGSPIKIRNHPIRPRYLSRCQVAV